MSKHREEILNDLRELEDRLRKLETAGRLNAIRASVYQQLYTDQLAICQLTYAYNGAVQLLEPTIHTAAMAMVKERMDSIVTNTQKIISAQVEEAEKTAAARLVAHDAQQTAVDSATEN